MKTEKGQKRPFIIKTPGSGCDVCIVLTNQPGLLYGKHGFIEEEIAQFYSSQANHIKSSDLLRSLVHNICSVLVSNYKQDASL